MTGSLPASAARWLRDHRWAVALGALVLVAGVAVRWWILRTPLGMADLDEATVGIQARRFNEGKVSVFFPNQAYGGTVETALVALSVRVFGTDELGLKFVPMALALVAALLSRLIAVELKQPRTSQWAVPVLVWLGPAYAVLFSTKERGFYGVALVLAAAFPLLALRLANRGEVRDAVLLGLAVGVGCWQTPLTFLVSVPAVGWLVCVHPRRVRELWWAVPAAVVGMAPWLAWNAGNDWASARAASSFGSTWGDRFFDWLERMQVVLGLETPFVEGRTLVGFRWAGLLVLVGLLVGATRRTNWEAPWFLVTMVVGYGLLYALNTLVAGVGLDPRYTYLMVPIVAVTIGAVLPDPPRDAQRFALVAGVGALAVATTMWGLVGARDASERAHPNLFLSSPGIERVAQRLEEEGVDAAITDTAGMQLAWLTDERVVGASYAVPRLAEYELVARSADPSTYVIDDQLAGNARRLRRWLKANDVGYREERIGKWNVFFLERRVLPGEAGLLVFGGRLGSLPDPTLAVPR